VAYFKVIAYGDAKVSDFFRDILSNLGLSKRRYVPKSGHRYCSFSVEDLRRVMSKSAPSIVSEGVDSSISFSYDAESRP